MPRRRDLIVGNLTSKGFEQGGGDHIFLAYVTRDGIRTTRRTKVSRGTAHRDVSDKLLGLMARQVGLSKGEFLQLVDCPMDRDTYEKKALADED